MLSVLGSGWSGRGGI